MNDRIQKGNDEFILYVRKENPACSLRNEILGRMIWMWIRDNANGVKIQKAQCRWGRYANNVRFDNLPYTATQFELDLRELPRLYRFLTLI